MTYCVGLKLKAGLVLLSDTRTNAGVDNVARFRKMFLFEEPGERVVALMTAGNLGITQGVVTHLTQAVKQSRIDPEIESLMTCDSLYRGAQLVGEAMRDVQKRDRAEIAAQGSAADATVIMAGQRKGGELRLFLIYTAGNFIEAGEDNPFFQIGETKYGRPIIVRSYDPAMSFEDAVKLLCVSFDSTIRANAGVDLPIDLKVHERDDFSRVRERRFERNDPYYESVADGCIKRGMRVYGFHHGFDSGFGFHGRDALGDALGAEHEAGAEVAAGDAVARAADVEVELVVAHVGADAGALGEHGGVVAAELQRDRALDVAQEAEDVVAVAVEDGVHGDHLGVEEGVARDLAQQPAVVPVGAVHHRRHAERAGAAAAGHGGGHGALRGVLARATMVANSGRRSSGPPGTRRENTRPSPRLRTWR